MKRRKKSKKYLKYHEKIIEYFKTIGAREVTVTDIQNDFKNGFYKNISRDAIGRHLKVLMKKGKVNRRGFLYGWKHDLEKKLLEEVLEILTRDTSWTILESDKVKRFYFPGKRKFHSYDYELWKSIKNKFLKNIKEVIKNEKNEKILICFLIDTSKF